MAVAACCNTVERLRFAVSCAKSASIIRERAAVVFSEILVKLETVKFKRLLIEPNCERVSLMVSKAVSIDFKAAVAPALVEIDRLEIVEPVTALAKLVF